MTDFRAEPYGSIPPWLLAPETGVRYGYTLVAAAPVADGEAVAAAGSLTIAIVDDGGNDNSAQMANIGPGWIITIGYGNHQTAGWYVDSVSSDATSYTFTGQALSLGDPIPPVGTRVAFYTKRPAAGGARSLPPPAPEPTPNDTWTKPAIVAWLQQHGVTLDDAALLQLTKAELLDLVAALLDDDSDPDALATEAINAHS